MERIQRWDGRKARREGTQGKHIGKRVRRKGQTDSIEHRGKGHKEE